MFETLKHLVNAYRARRHGKHPDDLYEYLDRMEEQAEDPTVEEFARDAKEHVGSNVNELEMEKEGVDFSNEATVLFILGAMWERHDIFTGDDL